MSLQNNDSLEHYGVKGMKWGVRRSQEQLDRAAGRRASRQEKRDNKKTSKRKARLGSVNNLSRNHSSKARLGSRDISQLSDKELRELTNRMDMERRYSKMSSGTSRGKRIFDNTLRAAKTFNDVVNTAETTYRNGKKVVDFAMKLKK